jgi:hypothetical protein
MRLVVEYFHILINSQGVYSIICQALIASHSVTGA